LETIPRFPRFCVTVSRKSSRPPTVATPLRRYTLHKVITLTTSQLITRSLLTGEKPFSDFPLSSPYKSCRVCPTLDWLACLTGFWSLGPLGLAHSPLSACASWGQYLRWHPSPLWTRGDCWRPDLAVSLTTLRPSCGKGRLIYGARILPV